MAHAFEVNRDDNACVLPSSQDGKSRHADVAFLDGSLTMAAPSQLRGTLAASSAQQGTPRAPRCAAYDAAVNGRKTAGGDMSDLSPSAARLPANWGVWSPRSELTGRNCCG